jgi:hypothetical protein
MKNLKIGLTLPKKAKENSLWSNGLTLNILFLAQTLQCSPNKYEIYLLTEDSIPKEEIPPHFKQFNIKTVQEGIENFDIIFIIGAQIKKQETEYFKNRKNTVLIAYHCGNTYMINAEDVLFKENNSKQFFYESNLDELWYVPQQHENNFGLYKTLYRTNAIPIPFVWNSDRIQNSMDTVTKMYQTKQYKKGWQYQKNKTEKTVIVMEPNISFIKLCTIPALITEQCYRKNSGLIKELMLTNATEYAKDRHFLSMMAACDIYKDKKLKVDARYQTAYVLSQYADVVVSHQLYNPLNYLYLDVAYMGYPLLHNAWMCEDLGYYYPSSDILEGAKQLEYILHHHDKNIEEYNYKNKQVIARYLSNNRNIVETYDILLKNLVEGKQNKGLVYNHKTNLYSNLL